MRRWRAASRVVLMALVALAVVAMAQETPPPAAAAGSPQAGIEARLKTRGKDPQRVVFRGRRDGKVVYSFAESPQVSSAVSPQEVSSVRFNLAVDRSAVAKARRAGDWALAGTLVGRGVAPALPFLDLPGNNAIPLAVRAGTYFLVAAEQTSGCAFEAAGRALAERDYGYAQALLKPAAAAEWSDRAETAKMLLARSLVGLNRCQEAGELLATVAEPDVMDENCGLYRLASAELLHASGDAAGALEVAIGGIVFEDKDINTFPTSLLLSAHCYAKLNDWHRARDVYYEVAVLFPGTHWDRAARAALQTIMTEGKTRRPEAVAAQVVFFGLDEDVNAKVTELLNPASAKPPPTAADTRAAAATTPGPPPAPAKPAPENALAPTAGKAPSEGIRKP